MSTPIITACAEVDAWAAQVAATLEPFDAATAQAVGRMAAVIDARRRESVAVREVVTADVAA